MSKTLKIIAGICVALLLVLALVLGGFLYWSKKEDEKYGFIDYPSDADQNFTANRIVDVLNFEWPDPERTNAPGKYPSQPRWVYEMQDKYGAAEGCHYSVKKNRVKKMTTAHEEGRDLDSPDDEIAVEELTSLLTCDGNDVNTLKIEYMTLFDAGGWSMIGHIENVDESN